MVETLARATVPPAAEPCPDCGRCPRLAAFRQANRAGLDGYFNAPVPAFGDLDARLLVVGLAPGLHGANRTGRPFTGDYAGDLLYETLLAYSFAQGEYGRHRDDGLSLRDCRITNAVRCVPPENKPLPAEIAACNGFLAAEIAAMPRLQVILALGRVAHDGVLTALGLRRAAFPFSHAGQHYLSDRLTLIDSYHCSRYNTNTGRLTSAMFRAVIGVIASRFSC